MLKEKRTSAREKILEAATSLFFEQGYQGTTIDDVVARSGVSRPTLYTHFSTKEDLGIAYLQLRRQQDLNALKDAIRKGKTPEGRFLAPISQVGETLLETDYRGCRFLNVIVELRERDNPLVKEARRYVENLNEIIRDVVVELKASNKKYKDLDVEKVTDVYHLLMAGAIACSQECQDRWPVDRAIQEIKSLIPE
ncbi:MAG: TetR/AcrR family transcriptional regulator [Nitrospirota bacterium]|nr:MAG: TetR/AcrR family transcriptional regulator [Nitrospirota bacterium]